MVFLGGILWGSMYARASRAVHMDVEIWTRSFQSAWMPGTLELVVRRTLAASIGTCKMDLFAVVSIPAMIAECSGRRTHLNGEDSAALPRTK